LLYFYGNQSGFTGYVFDGANGERMRIDASGNVGIGTSSPGTRLEVSGGVRAVQDASAGSNGITLVNSNVGNNTTKTIQTLFQGTDTVGTGKNVGVVQYGPADANWVGSYFAVQTRAADALSERMRIDSSGNVMVGTTTPTGLMSVNGLLYSQMLATDVFGVVGNNLYFGTSDFRYIGNGHAYGWAQGGTDGANLRLLYAGNNTGGGGAVASPTERIVIDNTGNVGIGTSSPASNLDVAGSQVLRCDASGYALFAPKFGTNPFGADYDRFEIQVDSGSQVTSLGNINGGTGAARALAFLAANSERMRIDTAGNVGIGTSSPVSDARLTLDSGGSGDVGLFFRRSGASQLDTAIANTSGSITFHTGADSPSIAGIAERMRIDSSGNVGIGTSSPRGRLTVGTGATGGNPTHSGDLVVRSGMASLASQGGLEFQNTNFGAGYGFRISAPDLGSGNTPLVIESRRNSATYVEAMRIDANGLVGIGTTSPAELLDVNGNVNCVAIRQSALVQETGTVAANSIGFRGLPQNSQTTGYTLVLADQGKHISITTGGVTIPANGTTAFPIGATVVVFNNSASTQTVGITTDTLRLAGTTTTGTRTIAAYGLCTLVKVGTTTWVATGNVT
jgi:hypothetical protein